MADESIPRRQFLKGAAVAGTAAAAGVIPATAAVPGAAPKATRPTAEAGSDPDVMLTLTASEAMFFAAAADTIIPTDEISPSGTECGVLTFIDRQLAGAWGGGAKMYRNGPFRRGKAEYGYQLPLTPREFFAVGIAATNVWVKKTRGKEFDRLSPKERDEVLKLMDEGKAETRDFDAKEFFEGLLTLIMEGFFSDPIYCGNKDKVSWKMIGYPGLPATYANEIERYRNKPYKTEPQSIADFS
jgi:gluconate 2-dehydrogenase gamma chain